MMAPMRLAAFACAFVLAGCAAQSAHREGLALLERGQAQQGLDKLEEAATLEPRSTIYQLALRKARERLVAAALDRAERQLAQGRPDDAERALRRALEIDGGNERAVTGLRRADMLRRHTALLRQAEEAWARMDAATAQATLRPLLLENPGDERARVLERQIAATPPTPLKAQAETALAEAYRKPMSIEFKEASLRTVFEVISRTSGLNFVFDKDVRTDQKTTLFLKNTTVEAAVQLVLMTNQLEQRILDANSLLVYPNTPAKQKDHQSLSVRAFHLANAEAKTVANTLKTIIKVKDVVVDEKLNLLIVRDSPDAIRLAEKLVALHDAADPEVMLEVEILEVKRSRLLDLGVRLPNEISLTPLPSAAGGPLTLADLRNMGRANVGVTVAPLSIHASRQDADTNILANPRIRVRNREKAKILIGERVPNISTTATATGFISESVTYVDVGLKLEVEPIVYPNNEVVMKVALEVSNIVNQIQTKSGTLAYQLGTRTASTVLRLRDGENQVLAGLINDEDRRSANKLPGLGEVPIIGRLFGNQVDDSAKTEIVLSITPRVVRGFPPRDAREMEFDSGTENSLGQRGGAAAGSAPAAFSSGADTVAPSAPGRVGSLQGGPSGTPAQLPQGTAAAGATGSASSGLVQSSGVALAWQGSNRQRSGETFTLQLAMQSDQPVAALPLVLQFDPRALALAGVVEGDFMHQGGARTSFNSDVDPGGKITVSIVRNGDVGATGAGVAVAVSFRVLAPAGAEAAVHLITAAPTGVGGRLVNAVLPLPHTVTVAP